MNFRTAKWRTPSHVPPREDSSGKKMTGGLLARGGMRREIVPLHATHPGSRVWHICVCVLPFVIRRLLTSSSCSRSYYRLLIRSLLCHRTQSYLARFMT